MWQPNPFPCHPLFRPPLIFPSVPQRFCHRCRSFSPLHSVIRISSSLCPSFIPRLQPVTLSSLIPTCWLVRLAQRLLPRDFHVWKFCQFTAKLPVRSAPCRYYSRVKRASLTPLYYRWFNAEVKKRDAASDLILFDFFSKYGCPYYRGKAVSYTIFFRTFGFAYAVDSYDVHRSKNKCVWINSQSFNMEKCTMSYLWRRMNCGYQKLSCSLYLPLSSSLFSPSVSISWRVLFMVSLANVEPRKKKETVPLRIIHKC